MKPLKICIISSIFHTMGGASKCAGLIFQHLDRALFDPYMLSGRDMMDFAQEYGVPPYRHARCDLSDANALALALKGFDIVFILVGSADTENEYSEIVKAARKVGVRLSVLSCIFGLGIADPAKADLFLCYSMEVFLHGKPCDGAHVVYCPVPAHVKSQDGGGLREKFGISKDAFVVGYACADQHPDFYAIAASFKDRRDIVFLSAISYPQFEYPPSNTMFCGGLKQGQMSALYDASDVILHARTESFGYSLYQAFAAEKPVIALWTSSRNAFAELMWPEGGYLARNVSGGIRAVEHVYTHRTEAAERAATALLRVRTLSPELAVPRYEYLMLHKLFGKDLYSSGYFEQQKADHCPSGADIAQWVRTRAQIETSFNSLDFV